MERSEINCYQALFDYFISQISPLFALQKKCSNISLSMEMNNDVIGVIGTHTQILRLLCEKKCCLWLNMILK